MNEVIASIGGACVVLALFLDSMSYWKQIAKTLRTKRSTQVSSSQYLYKIGKALCALIGLAIYSNWVGVGIEVFMMIVYVASLLVIIKYKPKGWRLFSWRSPKIQKGITSPLYPEKRMGKRVRLKSRSGRGKERPTRKKSTLRPTPGS